MGGVMSMRNNRFFDYFEPYTRLLNQSDLVNCIRG